MNTFKYFFLITFLSFSLSFPLTSFAKGAIMLFSVYEIILVCENESCYNKYSAEYLTSKSYVNRVDSYREVSISDSPFLESITKDSFSKYNLQMSDGVYLYSTTNCSGKGLITCNFEKQQEYTYFPSTLEKISDDISDTGVEVATNAIKENSLKRALKGEKEVLDDRNREIMEQKMSDVLRTITNLVYFLVIPIFILSLAFTIINITFSIIKKYITLSESWSRRSDLLLRYKRIFHYILVACFLVVITWWTALGIVANFL